MSLEMACTGCGRMLRAPDTAAGKKIRCPNCQAIQELPAPQTAAGETPAAVPAANIEMWQMKVPGGQTYGPVTKLELDSWVTEGRVTNDCHLLRVGSNEWQWAGTIFPGIAAPQAAGPQRPAAGFAPAPLYAAAPAMNPYASPYAPQQGMYPAILRSDRSKIAAGLLAIFLGWLGVHRFYLGFHGLGIAILAVTCMTGLGGIWGMIEGILILTGNIDRDAEGRLLQ